MVDQQFDPSNDNELDTLPPPGTIASSSTTLTPLPPTKNTSGLDIRQVSLDTSTVSLDVASSQEGTRARIAWTFTVLFLSLITLCILGPFGMYFMQAPGMQNPVEISKELLMLVSSVLAGPFGFIVGFYFKETNTSQG